MPIKNTLYLLAFGLLLYSVNLTARVQLTNIPTIYITTVDSAAVNNTSTWVPGFITVVGGDTSDVQVNDTIEIRGRGNSTWGLAKKPYRIKFNQKRHLLNMKDDAKDWVLLANYADKTLIRNAVAFEIGQFIGMEFTPSVRFADVYLNDVFLGNYMVTDQIEAGKNRVNVERLTTTDISDPNVTGGYVFERDGFNTGELINFKTTKSVPFSVKEPDADDITPEQKTYLVNFVNDYESTLFSTNWNDPDTGYRSKLDSASFFKWYIASELTGNIDCFWSTYMFKRRNDNKLYYGPLWDYDIAFDNDRRKRDISTVRMLATAFGNNTWITHSATDAWFKSSVNNVWKEIVAKDIKSHLQNYIDSLVTVLDSSIVKNYEKWKTINVLVYNEWYKYPTYQEYVNVLKDYINTRVDFLTTSFATDAPIEPTAPFKLEKFYYSVTNKVSGTIMDVQYQSTSDSARVVLYGPVENRLSQQWKLVPMSDGSFQFINRYTNKAIRSNGLNHTARLFVSDTSDTRQRWRLVPMSLGGGSYNLVNVSSGRALENTSGSASNNTLVNENPLETVESANQTWLFEKVEELPNALNDVQAAMDLKFGPNPTSGQLHVRIDGFHSEGRLEVFDLRGSRLLLQPINGEDATLNVHALSEGMYILRFTAGQQCKTVKFLVKH